MSVPPSVIIDTDAGVDDAMALTMAFKAHKAGKIAVKAVTTVTGNTEVENVVVNVLRVRKAAGVDGVPVIASFAQARFVMLKTRSRLQAIPVFQGAGQTFTSSTFPKEPRWVGSDGFNDVKFDETPDVEDLVEKESATDAILRLIGNEKGEGDCCPPRRHMFS